LSQAQVACDGSAELAARVGIEFTLAFEREEVRMRCCHPSPPVAFASRKDPNVEKEKKHGEEDDALL
jgi:hypothetical protein